MTCRPPDALTPPVKMYTRRGRAGFSRVGGIPVQVRSGDFHLAAGAGPAPAPPESSGQRPGADSRAAPRDGVRRRRRAARPVVLERPADSTSLTAAEAAVDKSATVAAGCFRAPPRREPRPAGNGRPWVLAGYLRTAGHRGVAGVRPGVQLADRGRRRGGRRASPGVRPGCEGPRCASRAAVCWSGSTGPWPRRRLSSTGGWRRCGSGRGPSWGPECCGSWRPTPAAAVEHAVTILPAAADPVPVCPAGRWRASGAGRRPQDKKMSSRWSSSPLSSGERRVSSRPKVRVGIRAWPCRRWIWTVSAAGSTSQYSVTPCLP